jgi:hypothetical protein
MLIMLMMLMPSASAGPAKAARLMPIGTEDPQSAPLSYRCHGYHGRVSPGISAGSTGGWPYFGWPGYPYLPSIPSGRLHRAHRDPDARLCCSCRSRAGR